MEDAEANLDAFSRELIRKLMRTDDFQDLWAKLAARSESLHGRRCQLDNDESELDNNGKRSPFNGCPNAFYANDRQIPRQRGLNPRTLAIVSDGFQQLTQQLNVALNTFINGTHMARYEDKMRPMGSNRDAVALYMAHLRLGQFSSSKIFKTDQFGLISRQLSYLLRSFTEYISSIYSVERCSFLAGSLLHLLCKFYHSTLSSLAHYGDELGAEKFRRSLVKFDQMICSPLGEVLERKGTKSVRRVSFPLTGNVRPFRPNRSNLLPRMEPVLVDGKIAPMPFVGGIKKLPSFLLSPELDYNRRRIAICRQNSGGKIKRPESFEEGIQQMRNEWKDGGELFHGEGQNMFSIGRKDIAALKEACEMTLGFIREMNRKRSRIAMSSLHH